MGNRDTKICAVIVSFNDICALKSCVGAIQNQVDWIVIVDNNSIAEEKSQLAAFKDNIKVTVILNERNLGVGTAINIGIEYAIENNFERVLMLDQDSIADSYMVSNLLNIGRCNIDGKIGLVVPRIVHSESKTEMPYITKGPFGLIVRKKMSDEATELISAITSGSLIECKIIKEIGMLEGSYFIDYIDKEFSNRLICNGYKIICIQNAVLYHSLGIPLSKSLFSFKLDMYIHNPMRSYYIARNWILTAKSYKKMIHWQVYEASSFIFGVVRRILFDSENQKKHIRNTILGLWHGLKGRSGYNNEI